MKIIENLHLGRDIYIIGNGAQINELSDKEISFIESQISIGCNCSFLAIQSQYYISGHFTQLLLQHFYSKNKNKTLIFHGPNLDSISNEIDFIDLENVNKRTEKNLFTRDSNILIGGENVMFSSMHIAYMMGAKRIIFVGFDQKSMIRFYHNLKFKNNLIKNVKKLLDKVSSNSGKQDINDFLNVGFKTDLNGIEFSALNWNTQEYERRDFSNQLSELISFAKDVEFITTYKNSFMYDIGVKLITLNKLMDESKYINN